MAKCGDGLGIRAVEIVQEQHEGSHFRHLREGCGQCVVQHGPQLKACELPGPLSGGWRSDFGYDRRKIFRQRILAGYPRVLS